MEKNKRKNRQDEIREAAKYTKACTNVPSFEAGAKWADYHPYWREDLPKEQNDKNDLPKLYLCQILTVDMTFGYRYSYRIGFITDQGKWNIEQFGKMTKVVRWMDIYGKDSESQLIADIQKYENESNDKTDTENEKDNEKAA